MKAPRITREDLSRRLAAGEEIFLLDVRNSEDYASSGVKLKGAARIPLEELVSRISEIPRESEVVAYCT